jgi:hypothetical protein
LAQAQIQAIIYWLPETKSNPLYFLGIIELTNLRHFQDLVAKNLPEYLPPVLATKIKMDLLTDCAAVLAESYYNCWNDYETLPILTNTDLEHAVIISLIVKSVLKELD